MEPLPMITPSIVSIARILLARKACMARDQVSLQKAAVFCVVAIRNLTRERRRRAATGTSRVFGGASALPCAWAQAAEPRGTVPPRRRAFPAPRKGGPPIRVRQQARASHCDPACLRDRISNRVRRSEDLHSPAPQQR